MVIGSSSEMREFLAEHHEALFGSEPIRDRAFPDAEYAARQQAFRTAMNAAGVDAVVVTAPDTMAWLHGFRSRWYRQHTATGLPPMQCTVIGTHDDALFMIEVSYHRELVTATSCVTDIRVLGAGLNHEPDLDDYVTFLIDQLNGVSATPMTVGLELWSCVPSPAVSRRVEAALERTGHRVVDVTLPVRLLRRRKSPAEILMLEKAQAACDAGLLALREQVTAGTTELQAWAIYSAAAVAAGGEPAALHETVAAGPLMPSLHRISSRRPIGAGRVFHADAATSYLGYHARATRPYVIGQPPPQLHELTALAAGAYDVLRAVGRVGTPWRDLTKALREYVAGTGVDGGASGYEMGITVPPADWVNELLWSSDHDTTDGVIEANTVTNFETWNVVALVDLVVFEEAGPRVLSAVPPELIVVADAPGGAGNSR